MLEVLELSKTYGHIAALRGVSLRVERGQLLGFLGPNGAGKTTTMRSVFGLVAPDSGQVRWGGNEITEEARLRFGYMPEERGLYPRMRNLDQVAYFGMLHGMSRHNAESEAARWLSEFGLADRAKDRLEELSHGNQQRLQLAAALVHSPDLLVLDEPFAGLDPLGVAAMGEILATQANAGTAVIFSSHQLDLVEDLCDDVVIINEGSVALAGAVRQLRAAAPHRHLQLEVRDAPTDWIDTLRGAAVIARDGDRVRLDVSEGVELSTLLEAAQEAGDVVEFSYEPPSLNEVFLAAVGQ
ncbi:MAG: ABC transporter ATP-binding protein [bacterium]|nr:ABC transporter ATP-binding protein [bacterium]